MTSWHEDRRIAHEGYVCGIDHSELMLHQATRRNAEGIRRGLVDLRLGLVDALPAFDRPFDKFGAEAIGRVLARLGDAA